MYSTHSDESYVPSDGESSKLEDAGIYDVGEALAKSFEESGIEVVYSKETFHPHDAGAYRRSRRTAEELLKDDPTRCSTSTATPSPPSSTRRRWTART